MERGVSGLGFTNPVGTGEVLDMCLVFWLWWCGWGVGKGLVQSLEGWCYVCVSCESGFSV